MRELLVFITILAVLTVLTEGGCTVSINEKTYTLRAGAAAKP